MYLEKVETAAKKPMRPFILPNTTIYEYIMHTQLELRWVFVAALLALEESEL
jgi:hypothetical protein